MKAKEIKKSKRIFSIALAILFAIAVTVFSLSMVRFNASGEYPPPPEPELVNVLLFDSDSLYSREVENYAATVNYSDIVALLEDNELRLAEDNTVFDEIDLAVDTLTVQSVSVVRDDSGVPTTIPFIAENAELFNLATIGTDGFSFRPTISQRVMQSELPYLYDWDFFLQVAVLVVPGETPDPGLGTPDPGTPDPGTPDPGTPDPGYGSDPDNGSTDPDPGNGSDPAPGTPGSYTNGIEPREPLLLNVHIGLNLTPPASPIPFPVRPPVPFELNASSLDTVHNTFDTRHGLEAQQDESRSNFNTLRIYPEDISNFPNPDLEQFFRNSSIANLEAVERSGIVDIEFAASSEVTPVSTNNGSDSVYAIVIRPLRNGVQDIDFVIYYEQALGDYSSFTQRVRFTVTGAYPRILVDINGANQHTINLRTWPLLPAGYHYTAVLAVFEDGAGNLTPTGEERAAVSLNPTTQILTINPISDGPQIIRLTAVPYDATEDGQAVHIFVVLHINTAYGSFFYGWAMWQIVLFWVAIALAALIVVGGLAAIFIVLLRKRRAKALDAINQFNASVAAERAHIQLYSQFDAQYAFLIPIMTDVHFIERDMRRIGENIEKLNNEKSEIQSEVAKIKAQYIAVSDEEASQKFSTILSGKTIRLAELETNMTSLVNEKSAKNIKYTTIKKKAHDYIDAKNISTDEVCKVEDEVIVNIMFDANRAEAKTNLRLAQDALETATERHNSLLADSEKELNTSILSKSVESKRLQDEIDKLERAIEMLDGRSAEITADTSFSASEEGKRGHALIGIKNEREGHKKRIEALRFKKAEVEEEEQKNLSHVKEVLEYEIEKAYRAIADSKEDVQKASDEYAKVEGISDITEFREVAFMSGSGTITRERRLVDEGRVKNLTEMDSEAARLLALSQSEQMELERQRAQEELDKQRQEMEEEYQRRQTELEKQLEQASEAQREELEAEQRRLDEERERIEQERVEEEKRLEEEERQRKIREEQEALEAQKEELRLMQEKAALEIEQAKQKALEEAELALKQKEATQSELATAKALSEEEQQAINRKIARRREEVLELRLELQKVKSLKDGEALAEKFNLIKYRLDDDEKQSPELKEMLESGIREAHAEGKLADAEARAQAAPKRVVKKVTERVNRIPRGQPQVRRRLVPGYPPPYAVRGIRPPPPGYAAPRPRPPYPPGYPRPIRPPRELGGVGHPRPIRRPVNKPQEPVDSEE